MMVDLKYNFRCVSFKEDMCLSTYDVPWFNPRHPKHQTPGSVFGPWKHTPPKKAKPQEAYLDVHRVDVPLDVPFNVSLFLLLPIVDDFPNRFSQTESRNRMISQLREARFGTVEAAKMVGSVKSGDCPA